MADQNLLNELRQEFPALKQKVHQRDLIYLDSAATTLKPQSVIDRITKFYTYETANVHRGAHYLADAATSEFEKARELVRVFLNASSIEEVIFTRGTTEGVNIVAQCYGAAFLQEGDEIVLTELEHHSDLVPWQMLAERKGCVLKFINILDNGDYDTDSINTIIGPRTKIVAFSGCSNTLGTFAPIEKIVAKAKSVGAVTLMDAAQYVSQKKTDVQKLGVDFLVLSAHKLFGPYGLGVLFGRKELLNKMPPLEGGGSMISSVEFQSSTYNHLPFKFEAGTPHISGVIGFGAALEFLNRYSFEDLFAHEQSLMKMAVEEMKQISAMKFVGEAPHKAAIISFGLQGVHHSDIGQILDQQGVAIRVGHHCTQPLLRKMGLTGTARASISIYNNQNDISAFIDAVKKAQRMLL